MAKLSISWIQPNPCGLGWVGLDLCNGLGYNWVEFSLTHHGGLLGQKILLTQPDLTHAHSYFSLQIPVLQSYPQEECVDMVIGNLTSVIKVIKI